MMAKTKNIFVLAVPAGICNSMSAVTTQTLKIIFVSILDKHPPKKQKFYEGIKNIILIRTFGNK